MNLSLILYRFLFVFCVFLSTRQLPINLYFQGLTFVVPACMFAGLLASVHNQKNIVLAALFMFTLLVSAFWAGVLGNDPSNIFRFYSILMCVGLAPMLPSIGMKVYGISIFLLLIQGVVVIFLSLKLTLGSDSEYHILRYFFKSNSLGDVYTFDGVFYRVQLLGNALLPLGFMLSYSRYRWIIRSDLKGRLALFIFGLAIVFAGNLTYYLILLSFIFVFEFLYTPKSKALINLFVISLLVVCFFLINYDSISAYWLSKFRNDTSSMGIRFQQIGHLISSCYGSAIKPLLGSGLGAYIDGEINGRVYKDQIYYEFQWLYILIQTGPIIFIILLFSHLMLLMSKANKVFVVYVFYILSAITNPYIFDSNHFVVIVMVIQFNNIYLKENANTPKNCSHSCYV